MFKSPKTTIAAILLLVSVTVSQISAILDGDPTTVAQWDLVVSQIIIVFGLLFARDNDVSSENAGIKK